MSLELEIQKRMGSFYLDVSLTAGEGVTGLLGASGCGKSMTLRCIAGILRPDRGRIVLNGRVLFDSERHIHLPPQQRRVGYLFQNYALFPNMTVEQNIACGLHGQWDRAARQKAVAEMIERMRLEGLERHRPHQLSGGQQQRVALARILVGQPELLLLDEPFSALDSYLREQLLTELRERLKEFEGPALLVTHSRDEAYELCSRLAIMEQGRLTACRDTREVFSDPGTCQAAVLTGCKNIAPARKAGEHLVEVPSWGVRLACAQPVREELQAVAIRAHYFGGSIEENAFPVRFVEEIEEPFAWILKFQYAGQDPASPPLWWRVSKGARPQTLPEVLGVSPVDVLPLYG